MTARRWFFAAVAFCVVFMVFVTIIAIVQEDVGWGWWWAVPLTAGFFVVATGFRLLVQRADEAAGRADRALDEAERRDETSSPGDPSPGGRSEET